MTLSMENLDKASAIIIFILLLILASIILGGLLIYSKISANTVKQSNDPCEKTFDLCKHDCGEGTLSGNCKQGCTNDYRNCKGLKPLLG